MTKEEDSFQPFWKEIENCLSHIRMSLDVLHQKLTWDMTRMILNDNRYHEDKRLPRRGYKVYSQTDEDGIIDEVFRRIGIRHKRFVEIGVGNGLENNTLNLLLQGWKGIWIEANEAFGKGIQGKFKDLIESGNLQFVSAFVTKENINSLLRGSGLKGEVDLLSVDIDGNEYHVIEALEAVNPRVIVTEYNAKFRPPMEWVMRYDSSHVWDATDYQGASLKSLEKMLYQKGYCLVGCNISGVNGFFVRRELADGKFCEPFTAENHYEPARYWLALGYVSGHPPNFGPFDSGRGTSRDSS